MPCVWKRRMFKLNLSHMSYLEHGLHNCHHRWVSASLPIKTASLKEHFYPHVKAHINSILSTHFFNCLICFAVRLSSSSPTVSVNKNCSSLLTCVTPLNTQTEWSVNQGFQKVGFSQLCCASDDCNFPTLGSK